jgi:hypothetical protein
MAALGAVAGLAAPAAAADPLMLKPAAAWTINYGDDSCQLVRQFGQGDQRATLAIEQVGPADQVNLIVSGPAVAERIDSPHAEIAFLPGGERSSRAYRRARMADGTLVFALDGVPLALFAGVDEDNRRATGIPTVTVARANRISTIAVSQAIEPLWFQTGPMGEAMEALHACTEDLVRHWGVDPATLGPVARVEGNPGSWITASDYPKAALRGTGPGRVNFLVSVDPEGKPSACRVLGGEQAAALGATICDAMMRRAHFKPARDARGHAVPSFWSSGVLFAGL